MPKETVSNQCANLLESFKTKLIKVNERREYLVKLLDFKKCYPLNNEDGAGANEELYKFLHKNYKGVFTVQAQAISKAEEHLTKATVLRYFEIQQSIERIARLYEQKEEKNAENEKLIKEFEYTQYKEKEELECKLAEAKNEFTSALNRYLESKDNRGVDDPLEGMKEHIESYKILKQETENKQSDLENLNEQKEKKNAEAEKEIKDIENAKCIATVKLKGKLEEVEKDEFKEEVTAISDAQQALADGELPYNDSFKLIQNEIVAFNNKVDIDKGKLQVELKALEDKKRKIIEALYKFLHKNYECSGIFKGEVKAISDAQKALAEAELINEISIKDFKKHIEELENIEGNVRCEQVLNLLDLNKSAEREKLNAKLEEAKNEFTSVAKTFLHSEVKGLEKLCDISKFSKLLDDYEKCKEGSVRRLEEYLNLINEFKKSYDSTIENYKGKVDKVYLEKLQGIGKEIDSFLDDASKLKPTKPSFSARASIGFKTAMNFLKKNQKTLRNIAGSLLVIVSIYNIAAIIAGFNALALMASIATLTSTLPLVLASAEIALITFAGMSLIAYTATDDKVRKACSLKDLKESSTKPNSRSGPKANTRPTPGQ